MPFLYFPTDKTEYLPAIISLVVFIALACVAMYLFNKKSKKDEQKFNEQYESKFENTTKSPDNR